MQSFERKYNFHLRLWCRFSRGPRRDVHQSAFSWHQNLSKLNSRSCFVSLTCAYIDCRSKNSISRDIWVVIRNACTKFVWLYSYSKALLSSQWKAEKLLQSSAFERAKSNCLFNYIYTRGRSFVFDMYVQCT